MSEFHVEVVQVGPLRKNENAESLMITKVRDYVVQIRTGEFQEGDLAVYVPVDACVPREDPRWEFLKGHYRIKSRKLRGVFSMGLLTKATPDMKLGNDVAALLGITKYEPPEEAHTGGESERCPFEFPKYTDLESIRRQPDILRLGEEVVLTEKVHGSSSRFVWKDGRLWVGSHGEIKKEDPNSAYWRAAVKYDLASKLKVIPGVALYGEIYGWMQDLRYGHKPGEISLVLFDAMDLNTLQYRNAGDFESLALMLQVPMVPVLYRGPWTPDLKALAEGKTTLSGLGADHVREGFVVRPAKERFDERVGRVALKYHGEGYLLK